MPRLLVVSHACVLEANQAVYDGLLDHGWDVHLVVPDHWKDPYRPDGYRPSLLPRLAADARAVPVLLAGREQRYVHLARPGRIIDAVQPHVAFLEAEPFAMSTTQWMGPLRRRGIPFGVQQDENLDRRMPLIARVNRRMALQRARFVWARSPRAAELARKLNPRADAALIPHAVIGWEAPRRRASEARSFTIGYAGRFVTEKGVDDLLNATAEMDGTRLLMVGNGPLAAKLRQASTASRPVEVRTGVGHMQMDRAFAEMDVLVLPSRTTPQWAEQFGRVLVEALWCGCPVVGSSSGEIPWVIETTGGGEVFPEGDTKALRSALEALRDDPVRARAAAERGRAVVESTFGVCAVAGRIDEELRRILDGS